MQTEILALKQRRGQAKALRLLAAEQIVAAPTDTVYGLMGRFDSEAAIEQIYIAKGRPPHKGILTLIGDLAQLAQLTPLPVSAVARTLMENFWPGGLTIILPALPTLSPSLTAGQTTVGVRLPDHAGLRKLLQQSGPLAVTSANLSGGADANSADQVLIQLGGKIPLILADADDKRNGDARPSTIIDVSRSQEFPRILRRGALDGAINTVLYTVFGYAC
jgi:L-threonylcarbamoyladenylate synthase